MLYCNPGFKTPFSLHFLLGLGQLRCLDLKRSKSAGVGAGIAVLCGISRHLNRPGVLRAYLTVDDTALSKHVRFVIVIYSEFRE